MSVKVLDQEQAQMKAVQTEVGQRTLDFYAAAFSSEPDRNGDIIDPHAADAWLERFYAAGRALPISYAHGAIIDGTDPTRIIGDAPADPAHVWIDDYGVRVKASLYTDADGVVGENARAVARLVEQGVLGGASMAYEAEREKPGSNGSTRITRLSLIEAGPCLSPANSDAVVLGVKTADGRVVLVEKEASRESVEATVRLIAESGTVVDLDETQVKAIDEVDPAMLALLTPAFKHGAAPGYIQTAHDALVRGGAKCAASEATATATGTATAGAPDDVAARLRRLRLMKASIT